MAQLRINEEQLKQLLKEALVEVLEQRKGMFYEIVAEVVDDMSIMNAVREGESNDSINKSEAVETLEGEVLKLNLRAGFTKT